MFTGLIRSLGTVAHSQPTAAGRQLVVGVDGGVSALGSIRLGDSIAVNGCCLTVVDVVADGLQFDVIPQTLGLTTLGSLRPGHRVHLERALLAGEPLGGHVVQGHVDGTGTVVDVCARDGCRVTVSVDPAQAQWLLDHGSIALDGVSLTLARVDRRAGSFAVALIPQTIRATLLGALRAGDVVNLEFDQLAKAVVALAARR